jgi:hypothetical protein
VLFHVTIYQHDGPDAYRFQLFGKLEGSSIDELELCWRAASSILRSRLLVLDISGVSAADARGIDLLSRMQDAGARLSAGSAPASSALISRLGMDTQIVTGPVAAGSVRWCWRLPIFGRSQPR